jgi:hypothetical protein
MLSPLLLTLLAGRASAGGVDLRLPTVTARREPRGLARVLRPGDEGQFPAALALVVRVQPLPARRGWLGLMPIFSTTVIGGTVRLEY